jgi:hypothetical protein
MTGKDIPKRAVECFLWAYRGYACCGDEASVYVDVRGTSDEGVY